MRVFLSRFTPSLKPGDGHKIAWNIGEVCSVWKGQQKGRLFTVDSEGMGRNPKWFQDAEGKKKLAELEAITYPDEPLFREGYFDDAPNERVAFPEAYLWFSAERLQDREEGMKELEL